MIGFFPEPYPDELLYSLGARYSIQVEYKNKARALRELFGESSATAIVSLPCNLLHLIEVLPADHHYTVDQLIDEFTLLPFYSPFLPIERVKKIRRNMAGSNSNLIHDSSGIAPSNVRAPRWFKYCPVCALEDEEQFGERYWHRLHQLPGVEVCSLHKVLLEESNIPASNRIRSYEFFGFSQVVEVKPARPLDLNNFFHQILIRLANDANWLLHQKELTPGFSFLHSRYIELLTAKGFASKSGIISSKALTNAFIEYFSPENLEILQCSFDKDKPSRWLNLIFTDLKRNKAHHPLRHLLLIQFLGKTVEEFCDTDVSIELSNQPFGDAPWPCLDPTSSHFKKLTVHECHIEASRKTARTIGKFYCNCGFAYSRIAADPPAENQFQFDRLVSSSTSWENKLRELWNDPNLSLRAIGRQLGVDRVTVKYHASHQGLPFPRLGSSDKRPAKADAEFIARHQRLQSDFQKQLSTCRAAWLSIREKHPNAGRSELRQNYLLIHDWLYRNDSEWLEANQPSPYVRTESARKVDWNARDLELSERVKAVAINIKEMPGCPVRVTLKAISIALNQAGLRQKSQNKLPLTDRVLVEVIETDEEFAVRRIQWVINSISSQEILLTRNQLFSKAGIRSNRIKEMQQVQKAVNGYLSQTFIL